MMFPRKRFVHNSQGVAETSSSAADRAQAGFSALRLVTLAGPRARGPDAGCSASGQVGGCERRAALPASAGDDEVGHVGYGLVAEGGVNLVRGRVCLVGE